LPSKNAAELNLMLSVRDMPVFAKLCKTTLRALSELARYNQPVAELLLSEVEDEITRMERIWATKPCPYCKYHTLEPAKIAGYLYCTRCGRGSIPV
jgi:hypothetical protein